MNQQYQQDAHSEKPVGGASKKGGGLGGVMEFAAPGSHDEKPVGGGRRADVSHDDKPVGRHGGGGMREAERKVVQSHDEKPVRGKRGAMADLSEYPDSGLANDETAKNNSSHDEKPVGGGGGNGMGDVSEYPPPTSSHDEKPVGGRGGNGMGDVSEYPLPSKSHDEKPVGGRGAYVVDESLSLGEQPSPSSATAGRTKKPALAKRGNRKQRTRQPTNTGSTPTSEAATLDLNSHEFVCNLIKQQGEINPDELPELKCKVEYISLDAPMPEPPLPLLACKTYYLPIAGEINESSWQRMLKKREDKVASDSHTTTQPPTPTPNANSPTPNADSPTKSSADSSTSNAESVTSDGESPSPSPSDAASSSPEDVQVHEEASDDDADSESSSDVSTRSLTPPAPTQTDSPKLELKPKPPMPDLDLADVAMCHANKETNDAVQTVSTHALSNSNTLSTTSALDHAFEASAQKAAAQAPHPGVLYTSLPSTAPPSPTREAVPPPPTTTPVPVVTKGVVSAEANDAPPLML